MADFCKHCSIEMFGKDFEDFAGLTTEEDWYKGEAVVALCEGCGPIQVDPEGQCVSKTCINKGQEGHGLPWKLETPKQ